ncbi:ABC transporter ATP-binding protein [Futiania mangrovi]|uniref:ABC transporter ATP-binding protein n=1 Tax=Futiania mangrovi TaxID=2959716 RepID=A0A9J6PAF9_9PROT|nr:ABC transporter ATP-binding protein [Futiania mangrovii]MCP1336029.1 ABC transporter ATP-binding protein [Futiania mangrovii]
MPSPSPFPTSPERAPAIAVAGLTLLYGGTPLYDGFSAEFPAGRTTALLGRSGVGKSTLLKAIAGLAPAQAGRVTDGGGADLTGRVAYMDQKPLLMPWLSVLENVTLGARLRGERADTARARAILAEVGLAGRERDRPAALSGGMRQRAALARTLMEDKSAVLMDEPFSAVDAITRLELQALAVRMLAGRTCLLVTHDPLEALVLADRIHVLEGAPVRLSPALEPDAEGAGAPPRAPADAAVRPLLDRLIGSLRGAETVP